MPIYFKVLYLYLAKTSQSIRYTYHSFWQMITHRRRNIASVTLYYNKNKIWTFYNCITITTTTTQCPEQIQTRNTQYNALCVLLRSERTTWFDKQHDNRHRGTTVPCTSHLTYFLIARTCSWNYSWCVSVTHSAVCIGTCYGLWAEQFGVRTVIMLSDFLFPATVKIVRMVHQAILYNGYKAVSQQQERPGRGDDHTSPTSGDVPLCASYCML